MSPAARWGVGLSLALHAILLAALWWRPCRELLVHPRRATSSSSATRVVFRGSATAQSSSSGAEPSDVVPERSRGLDAVSGPPGSGAEPSDEVPERTRGLRAGPGPSSSGEEPRDEAPERNRGINAAAGLPSFGPESGREVSGRNDAENLTSETAASASLLPELHRRLAIAARSCYPAAARRYALKGAVRLAFALDAQGAATSSTLEGTTGSALLDRAALQCVLARAAPLPALPGKYTVVVRFDAE